LRSIWDLGFNGGSFFLCITKNMFGEKRNELGLCSLSCYPSRRKPPFISPLLLQSKHLSHHVASRRWWTRSSRLHHPRSLSGAVEFRRRLCSRRWFLLDPRPPPLDVSTLDLFSNLWDGPRRSCCSPVFFVPPSTWVLLWWVRSSGSVFCHAHGCFLLDDIVLMWIC